MTLSQLALKNALTQKGLQEIPKNSNWGPNVQKYLNTVGINFPASWCMAFVHWCFDQAALSLGVPNPLFKSAGVLDVWNHTPVSYRTTDPQPGDIFILDFGNGHGHTGIVVARQGYYVTTIEGNSNENGSREGIEVEETPSFHLPNGRLITACKGFLRIEAA